MDTYDMTKLGDLAKEYFAVTAEIASFESAEKQEVAQVQDKFFRSLKHLKERSETLRKQIESLANRQKKTLPKDKRYFDLPNARIGWKEVEVLEIPDEEKFLTAAKKLKLDHVISTKFSVARTAAKKLADDVLAKLGASVRKTDRFYIEAKKSQPSKSE